MVNDDNHRTRGIISKNEEIDLAENSSTFRFITRIQDEAHRFAISYHRSLRSKKMFKSDLDNIKGIGNVRKKSLLKALGSIDGIKNASIDELSKVDGMNRAVAEEVYNYFRTKKS